MDGLLHTLHASDDDATLLQTGDQQGYVKDDQESKLLVSLLVTPTEVL